MVAFVMADEAVQIPEIDELPPNMKDSAFKISKHYEAIRERLCQGVPIPEIARWIHDELQDFRHVKKDSLIRKLYRFKQTIPLEEQTLTPKAVALAINSQKAALAKEKEEYVDNLNELEEMERLFRLQMKRVMIDHAHEEKIGKLFGSTDNTMRLALDILAKRASLKIDMVNHERKLGAGTVNVQSNNLTVIAQAQTQAQTPTQSVTTNAIVARVSQNAESRRKVLGTANTLLRLATGDNADLLTMLDGLEADIAAHPIVDSTAENDADVDSDLDTETEAPEGAADPEAEE